MTKKKAQVWGINFNCYGLSYNKPQKYYVNEWSNDVNDWVDGAYWHKNGNDSVPLNLGLNLQDEYGSFSSCSYQEVDLFIKGYKTARVLMKELFKHDG